MSLEDMTRLSLQAAVDTKKTCRECGMACDNVGEFHPFMFCVLKKAGRDPWDDFRDAVRLYGLGDLPERPPRVRDLKAVLPDD